MPAKKQSLEASLRHIDQLKLQESQQMEFFLAASHQLKAPVAIIQWCLQSLAEVSELNKKSKDLVEKSLSQANAMSHLITDMLHVFRMVNRKDKEKDTYTWIDLVPLIQEIVAGYEEKAHIQKVHLVIASLEHIPHIFADPAYLRQAIMNLIDNAIKYSPKGGKVSVGLRTEKQWLCIEVVDEGIGISDLEQENLFKEFFRGIEAQDVAHDGTGLGLVLVKHVVEELGGEVRVTSRLHSGSTFTMYLPLAQIVKATSA